MSLLHVVCLYRVASICGVLPLTFAVFYDSVN